MSEVSSLASLVGKTIESVWLSEDSYYLAFVTLDGERLVWMSEGDCCAHAYFYQVEGANDLIGHTITSVEASEVTTKEGDYDVVDTEMHRIGTNKGEMMTIEFRTEHNGYYCGWAKPSEWPDDCVMRCIAPSPVEAAT